MRIAKDFKGHNIKTVYNGNETISYRGPLIWKLIPDNIKIAKSLNEFKAKIKKWKLDSCNCHICKTFIPELGFINQFIYITVVFLFWVLSFKVLMFYS